MFGGVRRGARPVAARRASPSFGLPGAAGAAPPVGYPAPPRRSSLRLRRAARPGIVAAIGAPARAQRMEDAMPGAATFDRLAAAESMAGAGIEEPHAKAIAATIRDSRDDLATKTDLENAITGLESRLQATLYRALLIQGAAIVGVLAALKIFG